MPRRHLVFSCSEILRNSSQENCTKSRGVHGYKITRRARIGNRARRTTFLFLLHAGFACSRPDQSSEYHKATAQCECSDWSGMVLAAALINPLDQVCTFHDGCKQGIDQQIFNRKSISRKITHPQSLLVFLNHWAAARCWSAKLFQADRKEGIKRCSTKCQR